MAKLGYIGITAFPTPRSAYTVLTNGVQAVFILQGKETGVKEKTNGTACERTQRNTVS